MSDMTSTTRAGSSRKTPDAEGAIVVGVGPEGHLSEGVVQFVVTTATKLGLGVEFVHVVPTLVGDPTGTWDVGITTEQLVSQGHALLDEVVLRVRERMRGAEPVHGKLLHGGAIATLVERSCDAQLVVLEHRTPGRRDWWGSGSVTAGVAAWAHAPVVSVPASWQPATADLPITVGVEDAARAAAELWTALGIAAVTDAPVVVLRATYVAPALDELLRHELSHEKMLESARRDLARDAALPEDVCERVPCRFDVRWGRPGDVLVEASHRSSLLVVAKRDPSLPFGSHLGPVVRHVLREATCPVLVVEPSSSSVPESHKPGRLRATSPAS